MDYLTINREEINNIKTCLSDFYYIGVRDQATEDFVKWSGCNKIPHHNCDPTAFLDVEDLPVDIELVKFKLKKRGFDFSRRSIAVMGSEKLGRMVKEWYGDEFQIVALYDYLHIADVNLFDLEPYEWAYVFRFFSLTFTTYFHGTLLSLRNGIPLICISLNTSFAKKHTPKTLDLLKRVGFEDWYFSTDYVRENTLEIKKKADHLLNSNLHDQIIERISDEASSFSSFKEAVNTILTHKEIET